MDYIQMYTDIFLKLIFSPYVVYIGMESLKKTYIYERREYKLIRWPVGASLRVSFPSLEGVAMVCPLLALYYLVAWLVVSGQNLRSTYG